MATKLHVRKDFSFDLGEDGGDDEFLHQLGTLQATRGLTIIRGTAGLRMAMEDEDEIKYDRFLEYYTPNVLVYFRWWIPLPGRLG